MKLYRVRRKDHISYDEFSCFVVRAESAERALAIAQEESDDGTFTKDTTIVIELSEYGTEEVISKSFHAG